MRTATRLTGPLFLIVAYYLALPVVVWATVTWVPEVAPHLPFGGIDALSQSNAASLEIIQTIATPINFAGIEGITLGIAIAAAVLLSLPVSWVYFITTRSKEIDRSFAQTIVVLPVVVAGIATIVQHSLALAFSLAGIVAAVRFRFTLNQPAHALYIFVSIAIGLAAGISALSIAYVVAVGFVLVNLLLWRANYGADLTTPFFSFLTGRGHDDNDL